VRRRDDGSASVWVLAFGLLVLMIGIVGAVRGDAVLARHRAEGAADLAALAGAGRIGVGDDECDAAGRLAAANGAELRRCSVVLAPDGRSGRVSVLVATDVRLPWGGARTVTASAVAGREPPRASTATRQASR
jgi:secretion/DNA translocation related TadE-like protein